MAENLKTMTLKIFNNNNWFYKEKFTFLLIVLFSYSLIVPFFIDIFQEKYITNFFFLIILLSAVFAVSSKKEHFILLLILSGLRIVLFCYTLFTSSENLLIVDIVLQIIFNVCLIFIIGGYFYKDDRVSRNTIAAAMICYILLVLLWSDLYFLVELKFPNSFTIAHEAIKASPPILSYFSFVTITTLGYGDISPVSAPARNLAVCEAFIGQMYVAILIARLVAIHTAQVSAKKKN
jgi:hypothetical protein